MTLPANPPQLLSHDDLAVPTGWLDDTTKEPNCGCGCPCKAHRIDLPSGEGVWHACLSCGECEGFWSES